MGAAASSSDTLKQEGNTAFSRGNYHLAERLYTEAISTTPTDFKLYSNRAAAYLGMGQYAMALADAGVVIALKPNWAKGYYRHGAALAKLERQGEAVQEFQRAAALAPADADIADTLRSAQAALKQSAPAGKAAPAAVFRGNGVLHTWGSGEAHSLGHGDTGNKASPKVVDGLRGLEFTDIACGTAFCVALTQSKEAYSWGKNNQGQCGVGHAHDVGAPQLIPQLIGLETLGVACGVGHAVVLTPSNVYTWGIGAQGQLGYPISSSCCTCPTSVPSLEGQHIVSATCGIAHTVVVDKHGVGFGFGWNHHGQLGFRHTDNVTAPTKLALPAGVVIQHVACGGAHTAVVSSEGHVYTCGSGNCGQLGHGDLQDFREFRRVDLSARAAYVACGEEFTVVVGTDHKVYTCGFGQVGQMGDGKLNSYSRFTHIPSLDGCGVVTVACSQGQCLAVTKDGDIFAWGLPGNEADMVALNPAAIQSTPTRLRILAKRKLVRLECGRKHYCAVVMGTHAPHCTVDGIQDCRASERTKLQIAARDLQDEPRTQGGDVFAFMAVHHSGRSVLDCAEIYDEMDGRYTGHYVLVKSGEYSIAVTYGGVHIQGSPFHIQVAPGPPHPPKCTLETWTAFSADDDGVLTSAPAGEEKRDAAPDEVTVVAGEALYFTVTIVDKCLNRIEDVDATALVFKVDGTKQETSTFRQDDGDLYTSVTLHKAGTVKLQVFYMDPEVVGSSEIGSAITVHVVAGDVCPSKCILSGEGLEKATAGEPSTFAIQALDNYGNACAVAKGQVKAVLVGGVKPLRCKKKGDKWVFTPSSSGTFELTVSIDDVPVGSYKVQVAPGKQSLEESEAEEDGEVLTVEARRQLKAAKKAEREAKREAAKAAAKAERELEKLKKQEMVRRLAQEALAKVQQEMRIKEEQRRQKASAKRTGGGFVIKYDTWMDKEEGASASGTPVSVSGRPRDRQSFAQS